MGGSPTSSYVVRAPVVVVVGCDGVRGCDGVSWIVVVVVVNGGGGGNGGGGWDSPGSCALLLLSSLMVVRRVEGCGLRLWRFVSHTGRRNNIFPKLACTLMPS